MGIDYFANYWLNENTQLVNVHRAELCNPHPCPLHRPSGHPMAAWKRQWSLNYAAVYRECPQHEIWHPDPDDQKFAWLIDRHNCFCGCCKNPSVIDGEVISERREIDGTTQRSIQQDRRALGG